MRILLTGSSKGIGRAIALRLAKAGRNLALCASSSSSDLASISGVEPYPGAGAYSPSKAALITMMRVLAQEWAADGIRANVVSPDVSYMTARSLLVDGGLLGSIQGRLAGRPTAERER